MCYSFAWRSASLRAALFSRPDTGCPIKTQPGPTGDYIKSTLHGDVHGAKDLACGLTIGPWGPCLLLGLILRQIEVISHFPLVCSKVLSDKNLAYSHQLGMVQRCFGQKEVFSNFTVRALKQPIPARRSKSPFEFYDMRPHLFFQKFLHCGQEWSIFSNICHFQRGVMLRFGVRSINAILVNWPLWR